MHFRSVRIFGPLLVAVATTATNTASAHQCLASADDALRTVVTDLELERKHVWLTAHYYQVLPPYRLWSWSAPDRWTQMLEVVQLADGKPVWVIESVPKPGAGVRGESTQYVIDSCTQQVLATIGR